MNTRNVIRLAEAFKAHGKELYLVGGTVRDDILGRDSHDIDCATNALPEEIKDVAARTSPLHIIPIGEKFGTIQVQYIGYPEPEIIEITTYRGERYTPGSRKPDVQFGDSLIEDLRRRDFTINAIARDALTGEIIDPFEGQRDSIFQIIRAVENPAQRFADDPLRILRAIRFAVQLHFQIETETRKEITRQARSIRAISLERIRDELCKILLAENRVYYGFCLLRETVLLPFILPEIEVLYGIDQSPHHSLDVYGHTFTVVHNVPTRLPVRLAALLHDIAKPQTRTVDEQGITHFYEHEDIGAEIARDILRRLRFGNDVVEYVAKIVKLHMRVNSYTNKWSNGAVRRLYLDAGDALNDLLDLAIADGSSDTGRTRDEVETVIGGLRTRLEQVGHEVEKQPLVSPLNGNELMEAFGRKPGPWLKSLKEHLHNLVIEGVLQVDDKEQALAKARAFMEKN